jgi:hypothetical protein
MQSTQPRLDEENAILTTFFSDREIAGDAEERRTQKRSAVLERAGPVLFCGEGNTKC